MICFGWNEKVFGTEATNGPILPASGDRLLIMVYDLWNGNWQGKLENSENNLSQYHFVHQISGGLEAACVSGYTVCLFERIVSKSELHARRYEQIRRGECLLPLTVFQIHFAFCPI
jgi:hypothetical protein